MSRSIPARRHSGAKGLLRGRAGGCVRMGGRVAPIDGEYLKASSSRE